MAVGISYIMTVGLKSDAWYIFISFGHSTQDMIIYEVFFGFSFVVEKWTF